MRQGDVERFFWHGGVAVEELAALVDRAGDAEQMLEPVAGGEAGEVTGAAGDELQVAALAQDLDRQLADGQGGVVLVVTPLQSGLHGLGLFVYLLQHVVLVAVFFDFVEGQLGVDQFAFAGLAAEILDAARPVVGDGDVAVLKADELLGYGEQGHGVRGDEGLVDADAEDQRVAEAGADQRVRREAVDDRDGVGAGEAMDGRARAADKVAGFFGFAVDQVGDDFGVGLRAKLVAVALELVPQLLVVFDDAVVHHGDAVAGTVRMGVGFARLAVGGPTGVGDAEAPVDWMAVDAIGQHFDFALHAGALKLTGTVDDGDAGRIIAPVFKPPQAGEQNRGHGTLGQGCNDAAHAQDFRVVFLSCLRRTAHCSISCWWLRLNARAWGMTFLVMVEPAPMTAMPAES